VERDPDFIAGTTFFWRERAPAAEPLPDVVLADSKLTGGWVSASAPRNMRIAAGASPAALGPDLR
jgi:hypothetical protein